MLRIFRKLAPVETTEVREGNKIRVTTTDGTRTTSTTMSVFKASDVLGFAERREREQPAESES
jgi:hypothetical protein